MDMMHDTRARTFGNLGGRIILLGDGTEIDPNSADAYMFDDEAEEGDLEHQVHRVTEVDESEDGDGQGERGKREGTPGPETTEKKGVTESPDSTKTEGSEAAPKEAATKPEAKTEEKAAEGITKA